jgi:hypothetical protein
LVVADKEGATSLESEDVEFGETYSFALKTCREKNGDRIEKATSKKISQYS